MKSKYSWALLLALMGLAVYGTVALRRRHPQA